MRPPRITPLVTDIIHTALTLLDTMEFTERISCPVCGGVLQGYDRKKKKFAVLRQQDGDRIIYVWVKRFYCRQCDTLCYAEEPFYPGSRIGSPVIDIFSTLSATMPASRAARVIDAMGIVVHRTTWKNYCRPPAADSLGVDVFGIRLPLSVMRLSEIAVQPGEPDPAQVIAACGYPSRKRGSGDIRENGSI